MSSSSSARNPVTILHAGNFPATSHFYYEVGTPNVDSMDTNVAYAGVANFNRDGLVGNALGIAIGFFEPPKTRWLGGLAYHAILPEPPRPHLAERPDPHQIEVRNELAAKFAAHLLTEFTANYVHRPKVTGVEPGWDLGSIYAKLSERIARDPWRSDHREYLAVMLSDPGFNAVVMAKTRADLFSEDDCVDGDPTKISIGKFINRLNNNARDSRAIFNDIYTVKYARAKTEFVQAILGWANGKGGNIFGRVEDFYTPPKDAPVYL